MRNTPRSEPVTHSDTRLNTDTFTVRLLEAEREVQDAVSHLGALARRFVEKIVQRPVRLVAIPTKGLDLLTFRETLFKAVALNLHFKPEETRAYQELLVVARRDHARAVDGFIEENLDLLAEVKFGTEAKA